MSVQIVEYDTEEIRVADMAVGSRAFGHGDMRKILAPVRYSVEMQHAMSEYEASLSRFSRPQRLAHAVFHYADAIRRSGHCWFFNSPGGIVWADALAGLREIGAAKNALILSGAALRLGCNPPFDRKKRQLLVGILKPRMDDLDAQFLKCNPRRELWNYMLTNRQAFEFRGQNATGPA